jgi:hypothetical protein
MKKRIITIGLLCILFATSCSADNQSEISVIDLKEDGLMPNTIDIEEVELKTNIVDIEGDELSPKTIGVEVDDLMMDMLKLVEGNKKCIFELFIFDYLQFDGYDSSSDNKFVQVHSDEFPTFADLERYVRYIYCDEESNRLLYGNNGNALYLDVDGVLYLNGAMLGGRGYDVNWDDYKIVIRDQQGDTCDFDLVTTEDYYGDLNEIVRSSEIILPFQALLENNVWKLKEMVY